MKGNTMVDVICYGTRKTWNNRNDAIKFYLDGVMMCDGSERERYMNVCLDLLSGKKVCSDGMPERNL